MTAARASSTKDRSRRWLRLAVPFAVVLLFWALTGLVHLYEEPSLANRGTLSPTGTGRHGSSQLAGLLRDEGITVQTVDGSAAATAAMAGVDATVFVPAPDYLTPGAVARWVGVPGRHRIVLVQPGLLGLIRMGLPVRIHKSRWATGVAAPDCDTDYARAAGPAGVRHEVYEVSSPDTLCYGGSLIAFTEDEVELAFIGATDPFRNDRIGERGNARLATGLLGDFRRVIWVDLHQREPAVDNDPPEINFSIPEYNRDDRDRGGTGDPTFDAFPPAFWAVLVTLAAGAVLLTIARARRLGPPVPEPLPVLVPAAEAVTGRGRLYQRIAAREASLDALRTAAIARLARVLDPLSRVGSERELAQPGPAMDRFVAQLAARTGWPDPAIRDVLYGHTPGTDDELRDAVGRLDQLVRTVTTPDPRGGTP